jgi:hypothetical protein
MWAQPRATETTICDIVRHPSQYVGKLVRVRVQEGVDRYGTAVLTKPLSPDFKIAFYKDECTVAFESEIPVPKDWVVGLGIAASGGPIFPVFPLVAYGPETTVIAKARYDRKAEPKPVIYRDGPILTRHFFDEYPRPPLPEILLVIQSIDK